MSAMDIDSQDEKESTPAMSSFEVTGDATTGSTSDEKGVERTLAKEVKATAKRDSVPDSEDDSSDLSEISSPVLSRASISETSKRKPSDHAAAEHEDAMDVDSAPLSNQEALAPTKPNADNKHPALSPSRVNSRSPSATSAVQIVVDKKEELVEGSKSNTSRDNNNNINGSTSPSSSGPPLLTPGTRAGSLSNRALSSDIIMEGDPKLMEPHRAPVVELSADEKEALMTLNAMLATVPAVVSRAAVKEHASKCLVGSTSDEIAFLDTIFSQASNVVTKRFLESNQERILDLANQHSKQFLDRALEIRVEDIDGKKLAGYLARAGRLGFEEQDDIDGESALPVERPNIQVISSDPSDNDADTRMHPVHSYNGEIHGNWNEPPPGYMHNPAYPNPYFSQQGHAQGMKVCHKCGAAFKQNAGLRYHLEKDVCKKAGVPQGPVMARCEACGKEFRSPGGYHYHMTNNVCGGLLGQNSTSPPPEGEAQYHHGATSAGQAPMAKEEGDVPAPAVPPAVIQTPFQAALPHMFQNAQQQPYQGPYQNPPIQQQVYQPPPMPERILPSMNGTPQPTAASGEQIVNTNGLLTPQQAQKLNEDLRAEDRKYEQQLQNIDPSLTGTALDVEIKRLKAGMSTRKSNLRRKHGIFVRKTDKTAANAVRNEDGSIDIAPAGKTISVGSGFAPVHRPEGLTASPIPHSASRGPESPPSGMPDAKRRRVSDHPTATMAPSPSPYQQGAMGYPPNYNMHPGSYDPRQQHHMMPGPYQQYSMSPYSQPSPYQQHPMHHPPYGQPPPNYPMNTIIPAPGAARQPAQSPSPAMQGPPGPGYFPQSGFTSVNQPPPPTPPPGYMLVASPAPPQHYQVPNGQPHGHRPDASTSASPVAGGAALRRGSAVPAEKGKTRVKVPIDNAEKVWKAKQKDWVVETGPQHAFSRMGTDEKDGGSKSTTPDNDGDAKKEKIMKKKEKNEFIVSISDDEATDEDESARRPSKAASAKENSQDRIEREHRELSTSSELSELDDSALMGAGDGGEPYIVRRASEDSIIKETRKPMENKKQQQTTAKTQPPRTSGFSAVNAAPRYSDSEDDGFDIETISNARPPTQQKPAAHNGHPPFHPQQNDGSRDEDLEPEHEVLQVASEDEMVVDAPPPRRRAAAPATASSAPPSSSATGAPGSATAPGQPKKRLGRPVGWKKGMGGYRELLDAGVVHHNPEGTPNSRRRAERRAAERLRRQTEGAGTAESSDAGAGPSSIPGGSGLRQSIG